MMTHQGMSIDGMSDEDLSSYLASVEDRREARPTEAQREGGAPRELAILMIFSGIVGMFASLELILAEKQILTNPTAELSCDLNPLIGCGKFLTSDFNTLFFGVTNALFGLAFFAGVTALGLVLVTGGRFGVWLWRALDAAMVLAAAWLVWFQYTSFVEERALCPYCLLTWFVTIPLIVNVLARSVQAGHIPSPDGLRRFLVHGRWYIVMGIYAVIIVAAVVWFWDMWQFVF
ncbi:vitamin K epoxide reductase family protein [Arcanobacterium haemolyticum]|nr:vitamin K epoxide reductase family protein [Arcanobacterium haemolyticum]